MFWSCITPKFPRDEMRYQFSGHFWGKKEVCDKAKMKTSF